MKIRYVLNRVFDRLSPKFQVKIANSYYALPGRKSRRISYSDESFAHHFEDVVVHAPSSRLVSPQEMADVTLDIFCWNYTPKSGDLVIDIGAGLGTEALTFSRLVGPTGQVICVEPHPLISKCVAQTVENNNLANIRVEKVALSEKRGTVSMGNSIEKWFGNSIVSPGEKSVDVSAITFSDLLSSNSVIDAPVDFVKMNIEGAEWPVLQGMVAELGKVRNFAISCHDFKGQRLGNPSFRTYMLVADFLRSHGFKVLARADSRPHVADVVYASKF